MSRPCSIIFCFLLAFSAAQRIAVTDKVLNMKLKLKNHLWFGLDSSNYDFQTGYNYTFTIDNSINKMMDIGCIHTMDRLRSGQLIVSYMEKNKQIKLDVEKGKQLDFKATMFTVTAKAGSVTNPEFGCFVSLPPNSVVRTLKLTPISSDEEHIESGQFVPWRVNIAQNDKSFCTGSLVSNDTIITTRKCAQNAKTLYIADDKNQGKLLSVPAKVVIPIYFSETHNDYDITLIRLHVPVETGHVVRPLCLDLNEGSKIDNYALVFERTNDDVESVVLSVEEMPHRCTGDCNKCICMENKKLTLYRKVKPGDTIVFHKEGKYYFASMYSSKSKQGYNSWFTNGQPFNSWMKKEITNIDQFNCGV